ncbi:hypothetical protein SS50377_23615 [Spironucleus salmonicida]|uniref:Uncharacterized protein n=1 Tax=Spironucleus salmonicida TaxID=348837 RepID=V6LVC3_9EUKA|nr:hypothetical protein SS50377_23615 [Spironucleus salmonicida]|eukprot:EST48597.1 Hypothetical protein SS50377_11209 [Spironucleus salmonicida]
MKYHPELYTKLFIEADVEKISYLKLSEVPKAIFSLNIPVTVEQVKKVTEVAKLPEKLILRDFVRLVYILDNADPDDSKTILFLANDTDYKQKVQVDIFKNLNRIGIPCHQDDVVDIMRELADQDGFVSYELFISVCSEVI